VERVVARDGAALVYAGKLWFLDRMVWLYADMKNATPTYRRWSQRAGPETT
jgi:hypothetical protein